MESGIGWNGADYGDVEKFPAVSSNSRSRRIFCLYRIESSVRCLCKFLYFSLNFDISLYISSPVCVPPSIKFLRIIVSSSSFFFFWYQTPRVVKSRIVSFLWKLKRIESFLEFLHFFRWLDMWWENMDEYTRRKLACDNASSVWRRGGSLSEITDSNARRWN